MNSGDRVFHRQLGWGKVQRLVQMGSRDGAWVDFGYTTEFLRIEELQTAERGKRPPTTPRAVLENTQPETGKEEIRLISAGNGSTTPPVVASMENIGSQTDARKGVVALRLGQILESQIFKLSVGTNELESKLKSEVQKAIQQKPAFILVEGLWGGGKTHALTLLQAIARSAGFTTSSVVMDGIALSLSEPMQLMEEILSVLVFPKHLDVQNLGDLMRIVVKGGKIPVLKTKGAPDIANLLEKLPSEAFDDPEALGHIQDYFSLALSATQAKQKLNQLGHNASKLPTIRVIRVEDRTRAFCVLVRNWANLLSTLGSRGLLLLFDELDVEYASTAYNDQVATKRRERRKQFLVQMGEMTGHKAPLIVAFASAPAAGDVDPQHDAVQNILSVLGGEMCHVKTPVPDDIDLRELFKKLSDLYSQAYPSSKERLTKDCCDSIMINLLARYQCGINSVPRQFVRSSIEVLDLFAACEKPIDEVIRLIRFK